MHADAALPPGRGVQQRRLQVGHLPTQQRLLVGDLNREGLRVGSRWARGVGYGGGGGVCVCVVVVVGRVGAAGRA